MTRLLAIDPGMTTGVVWGHYDQTSPFLRVGFAEVPGGMVGLDEWLIDLFEGRFAWPDVVVSERFKPRPMARSYRLDELEPLRIEGYLWSLFDRRDNSLVFRDPETRGSGRDGVRGMERVLKLHNLWLRPSDIPNHGDANDANAAQMHALAYLRSIGHLPTIHAFFGA